MLGEHVLAAQGTILLRTMGDRTVSDDRTAARTESTGELLGRAAAHAEAFLAGLPERHVGPRGEADALRVALTNEGVPATQVIDELAAAADGGLVATAGGRYFGFVNGGALPAAVAADWLTSAWDQNASMHASSPAAVAAEETVERWVVDLLGLPPTASVGFTTGTQLANVTALAAARDESLRAAGWDAAERGLAGAPPLTVLAGEEAHATIHTSLRLLGLGQAHARLVAADGNGAMDAAALAAALRDVDGPAVVCAQAGNVNTGACDPLDAIADACAGRAWLHVDGAFGLWAAASREHRHLTRGVERADSWATDGHKWLNVPYDSGLVMLADRAAHLRAMTIAAPYLSATEHRNGGDYVPESSRRARAFVLYAALRTLGRTGVADLVDRSCAHARRFAELLHAGGAEILNDVVLNQVLVSFGDRTPEVIAGVQADGVLWAGGTVWRGRPAMRLSVSGWATTDEDVERSAAAILARSG
jgi:glutamate/tyrosine decarboxylase-like PLP-dependent enzyme